MLKIFDMKIFKINHFLLILLASLLISCNPNTDVVYENVGDMVNNAMEGVNVISVDDVKLICDHGHDYKIIDCREASEYVEGHIPGAVNIPRGILEFSSKLTNRRDKIYIYSQSVNRAALASKSLKYLKYKEVFIVDGGWEKWIEVYPELVEEGTGEAGGQAAAPAEEEGGCGG